MSQGYLQDKQIWVSVLPEDKANPFSQDIDQSMFIAAEDPRQLTDLGQRLLEQGDVETAGLYFQRALALRPDNYVCLYNCGITLKRLCRFQEAQRCFQTILQSKPDCLKSLSHLGDIYREYAQFDRAIEYFNQAIAIEPEYHDARFGLSLIYFLQGRWEEAWPLYDARLPRLVSSRRTAFEIPPERIWDGMMRPDDTLLVVWEQGIGDLIQFSRYLMIARSRVKSLVFVCPTRFQSLISPLDCVDQFVSNPKKVHWDTAVYLLSLPGELGTTVDDVPFSEAYIQAPSEPVDLWRDRILRDTFNVGLCWAGSSANPRDRLRSIELKWFEPLAAVQNIRLHSLQVGERSLGSNHVNHGLSLKDWSKQLTDFTQTAGLIHHLDLVITCDTSVAHLAGAMGKPVWMLVSHVPDWRWLMDCEDTPWYRSMRIFRQDQPGQWDQPVRQVCHELARVVK